MKGTRPLDNDEIRRVAAAFTVSQEGANPNGICLFFTRNFIWHEP